MTFDYITMDSTNYYVYVTFDTMKRSFEIVEGENKGTALTGRTIRDIIGTKYSYEFEVQPNPDHITDYDLFYNAITAPTDHHVITLPFGQNSITFECMVESGDDEFKGQYGDDNLWESFTVKCLPMEPQIITDTYGNQSIPSSAIVIGTLNITSNGTFKVPSNLTGWGTVNADVQIPSLIELSVTANGTYTPTYADQDGYSKVTVAVPEPVIQSKSITENGTYTAPTGVNGYSPVVVAVPEPEIESLSVTANGTYTAPTGTDGYSPVVVNVTPVTQELTVTSNGTYNAPSGVDGYSKVKVNVSGGGIDKSLFSNLHYRINSTGKVDNGFTVSGLSSSSSYIALLDSSLNEVDVDWSIPFEIGLVFKMSQLPSGSNALFGCYNNYYYAPSLEVQTSGGIWSGYSTSGSSWNYGSSIASGTIGTNTWYYLYYRWDGTNWTIGVTSDYDTYVTSTVAVSASHYYSSSYRIGFGGTASQSRLAATYAYINLLGTYVKSNGTLIWGSTYLEDNEIFDLP